MMSKRALTLACMNLNAVHRNGEQVRGGGAHWQPTVTAQRRGEVVGGPAEARGGTVAVGVGTSQESQLQLRPVGPVRVSADVHVRVCVTVLIRPNGSCAPTRTL